MPAQLTRDLHGLRERAANRPGDPVARAELCAALYGTAEGERCLAQTTELIHTALRLGSNAVALQASEILWRTSGDPRWAVLAAEAALLDGATDDGRGRLEAVVGQFPDDPAPRTRLSALALAAGDAATALRWIEPVATAHGEARAGYAHALLAAGRAAEAVDFARESCEALPGEAEIFLALGLALLATEQPGRAVGAFSEALRLDPRRPEAHYDLAVAFALDGSVPAAIGVVDAALIARPEDARLVALREQLLAQLRQAG
ncbi:MAG: hypothetical protein CVU56_03680 [Deltaproteobacteria bacterium HGW-Deltaproteobacteria-14]|jgi:tetratricopeptide (TPR) repeat protein|nr:MAG: hypothetical protein CVU56_03680 [Deltaproteobacteria bacterium HGW-Deltaproteobacteria-14]